jgi:hypothetical protein
LVDGEGSFGLYLAKDSSTRSGYHIQSTFQITLHKNDYALLEMVKEFFGVGGIYKDGDRYFKYSVKSLKDLAIIIKHFEEYPPLHLSIHLLFISQMQKGQMLLTPLACGR